MKEILRETMRRFDPAGEPISPFRLRRTLMFPRKEASAGTFAEPDVRVPAAILEAGDLGNPGTGVSLAYEE